VVNSLVRMRRTIVICAALLSITPAIAQKSRPHHRVAAAMPKPLTTHDCGHSVTLHLSAPDPTQGGLLLLELRSATQTVMEIHATWDDREIPFWQELKSNEKSPDIWRALLGVDLDLKPGNYPLALTAKAESAGEISCTSTIDVKEGTFATESLKVAPNFVEPNPEQLARAEAERQRLRAIFATITPERLWDGSFHYPLTGITTGGNFGKRRILNGKAGSPHSGVDFPAPSGTPVYAAQRGRVVLAEPLYFSGNTVILDHGLGLYTLYAHFESFSVQPGDLVDTGAMLGKVGATGRVTGPHLHWGATVNRARTNPLELISILGASAH
jgi:murein DD-endopeptidase MepM/ murein hydrolase activator NlpD